MKVQLLERPGHALVNAQLFELAAYRVSEPFFCHIFTSSLTTFDGSMNSNFGPFLPEFMFTHIEMVNEVVLRLRNCDESN